MGRRCPQYRDQAGRSSGEDVLRGAGVVQGSLEENPRDRDEVGICLSACVFVCFCVLTCECICCWWNACCCLPSPTHPPPPAVSRPPTRPPAFSRRPFSALPSVWVSCLVFFCAVAMIAISFDHLRCFVQGAHEEALRSRDVISGLEAPQVLPAGRGHAEPDGLPAHVRLLAFHVQVTALQWAMRIASIPRKMLCLCVCWCV